MIQPPLNKCRQNTFNIAAYQRYHLDALGLDSLLQRAGNGPAHQHVCTSLAQHGGPVENILNVKGNILTLALGSFVESHNQDVCRNVKHRTDPALPMRYRNVHHNKVQFK